MNDCSSSVASIVKGDKFNLERSSRNDLESKQMKNITNTSAVRSLVYAQVCTRPDVAYAIGILGKYQSTLGLDH